MKKMLEKVFSIKKENFHKVITLLGLKIKINCSKNKFIIYRRYFRPMIINDFIHSIIIHRNFINYIFMYNKQMLKFIKRFLWRICLLKFIFKMKLDISIMDFNITTKCSLRCHECGSMMPFYSPEQQWTTTFEQFKSDLDKLLKSVNCIHRLKLIGGEPLLVKDLDKMLEYAAKKKKIKTVEITTNGTILFSDSLLKTMKKYRKKILVVMSNYSSNKDLTNLKYSDIKQQLIINRIDYLFPNHLWTERGEIYNRKRSINSLKKLFKKCWQRDCIALMDGKFHHCTRSIAIQRLTDFEFYDDEFIDIRKESPKSLTKKLRKFYLRDYFRVCSFCTNSRKRIPRAVQTNEILKIGQKNNV